MTRRNVAIALTGVAVAAAAVVFTLVLLGNKPEGAGGGVTPTGSPEEISSYWNEQRMSEATEPEIIRP